MAYTKLMHEINMSDIRFYVRYKTSSFSMTAAKQIKQWRPHPSYCKDLVLPRDSGDLQSKTMRGATVTHAHTHTHRRERSEGDR